ncbi:hypothetical protein [Streptomyces sp. NPDC059258]|uniref:hypothetical protein n=1 Tax=unclassified Streptomyces TaxID=2593676 RepID=UPI0036A83697
MIALVVTIALAFAGYVAAYLNGLRLAQRSERLARVNRQLSGFYGPLFAITEANSRAFDAFAQRNPRPDGRSPFDMPPILLKLCAHVSGYEITAARWAQGQYDQHQSVVSFPSQELADYAREGFTALKAAQGRLLGRRRSVD